jgi:hypothetical protein
VLTCCCTGGGALVGVFLAIDRRGTHGRVLPAAHSAWDREVDYLTLGLLMAATMVDITSAVRAAARALAPLRRLPRCRAGRRVDRQRDRQRLAERRVVVTRVC